jgi:hypothetical protein
MVDVVELGDARVPGGEHLLEATTAGLAYGVGREPVGECVHPLAPGPEIVVGARGFDPLDRTPQPPLKCVAVVVDEPGSQCLARQTFTFRGRTDPRNPSILDRHTDAALRAMRIDDEIRKENTPHDERRKAR